MSNHRIIEEEGIGVILNFGEVWLGSVYNQCEWPSPHLCSIAATTYPWEARSQQMPEDIVLIPPMP